jgi:hypothetical protein
MTPTLIGRWQTRLLLLATIGSLITLLVGRSYDDLSGSFILLCYVLIIGLAADVLYQLIQSFRWDEDWPMSFQLLAGLAEGVFLWGLISLVRWEEFGFLGMPGVGFISFSHFFNHYAAVWFAIFLVTQGPLRVIFPRWRFFGGRWL